MAYPVKFWETEQTKIESHDWTFAAAATRDLTHCYHDYPARMIPQIAGKLLDIYAPKANLLFDPCCGSGTSLVEGMVRGINVIGTDLNPLACLISKAKTSTPMLAEVKKRIAELEKHILSPKRIDIPKYIPGISRLDFWFKPQVIEKLSILKCFINDLTDEATHLFFKLLLVKRCGNVPTPETKNSSYIVIAQKD